MTKNRFVLAIALSILGLASSLATIQLQPARANASIPTILYEEPGLPPLDDGRAPGDRKGGATRDGNHCNAPLMALVPAIPREETEAIEILSQTTKESPDPDIFSRTTKESPALWFYVPYASEFVAVAEFDLLDAEGKSLYRERLNLSGTPGIIRIDIPSSLPATEKALEIGQMYKWYLYLDIDCKLKNSHSSEKSVNVHGWLQRVRSSNVLKQNLKQAKTDLELAAAYAEAGIWQDALTLLAEEYRQNPELADVWTKFLKQARWELGSEHMTKEELEKEIEELFSADLVSCCAVEEDSLPEDASSLPKRAF